MLIQLDNSEPMVLTKAQRLMLANQYAIMALIDKKNAKDYEQSQAAITRGYASEIADLFDHVYDGLSDEQCHFVMETFAMYDALQRSYGELEEGEAQKAGLKESDVTFLGFDGNNETEYMAYARYIVEDDRYDFIKTSDQFNSHMPMISRYRGMLQVWKTEFDQSFKLAADEIKRVLAR